MKENYKSNNYPGGNIKTETYTEGDTCVTKHYHTGKHAYVKEFISEKDGIRDIKHFTTDGVLAKREYFKGDKREGVETKYLVSLVNKSVKSTKTYHDGKLHGECITYNAIGKIIKQEVFVLGKVVLKYLRADEDSNEITGVDMIDEKSIALLTQEEIDLIQENIAKIK